MADPGYNELLKWGIQNSDVSRKDPTAPPPQPMSAAHREALQYMLAEVTGTSDADSMVQSMDVVDNPEAEAKAKYVAFDNFEMLIENIDNANNLENRSLWTRLINHLENDDAELRSRAAWCCGIAVQNNIRSQERILVIGAIPTLVRMATADSNRTVRKKATFALSSTVRNFQPGLDEAVTHMPTEYKPQDKLDANDMESVDTLINKLRESV